MNIKGNVVFISSIWYHITILQAKYFNNQSVAQVKIQITFLIALKNSKNIYQYQFIQACVFQFPVNSLVADECCIKGIYACLAQEEPFRRLRTSVDDISSFLTVDTLDNDGFMIFVILEHFLSDIIFTRTCWCCKGISFWVVHG